MAMKLSGDPALLLLVMAICLLLGGVWIYSKQRARPGFQLYNAPFRCKNTLSNLSSQERQSLDQLSAILDYGRFGPKATAALLQAPAQLTDYLLLGGLEHAKDRAALAELGVTHVLNCAPSTCARQTGEGFYGSAVKYVEIHAEDYEGYPLLTRHAQEAAAVIAEAKETGGRCLVHCFAGMNRSAALCVSCLMRGEGWRLQRAVKHVFERRPIVLQNVAFRAQLVQQAVSYTHLRAHETVLDLVCRLLLEKKKI
eukprot:TRINITY_DN17868_c0_g1_i1.p1 TRINITY_DN17868_c0_g1~~TRINITY_DN17868_c0_g1_i1.p1  ORF type:complete len:254 (-),score=45.76 TRINITY_DN17868_c0_g1_i1:79-840(-)